MEFKIFTNRQDFNLSIQDVHMILGTCAAIERLVFSETFSTARCLVIYVHIRKTIKLEITFRSGFRNVYKTTRKGNIRLIIIFSNGKTL